MNKSLHFTIQATTPSRSAAARSFVTDEMQVFTFGAKVLFLLLNLNTLLAIPTTSSADTLGQPSRHQSRAIQEASTGRKGLVALDPRAIASRAPVNLTVSSIEQKATSLTNLQNNSTVLATANLGASSQNQSISLDSLGNGPIVYWKNWGLRVTGQLHDQASTMDVKTFADLMLVSHHLRQTQMHALELDYYPDSSLHYQVGPPRTASSMTLFFTCDKNSWTWQETFAVVGMFRMMAHNWVGATIPSSNVDLVDYDVFGTLVGHGSFVVYPESSDTSSNIVEIV